MKKSMLLWLGLLISFGLYAQRENTTSSAIFYQSVAKGRPDVPFGPCGHDHHDHDHHRSHSQTLYRTKPNNLRLKPASRWNSSAFNAGQNAKIASDKAPGINTYARRRTNYCAMPMVDKNLKTIYAAQKANMPLYLPYRSSKVVIWQGFYYSFDKKNNSTGAKKPDGKPDPHGSIDYGRTGIPKGTDPTFGVYAIAAGVVESITWGGGGNIVNVIHTAPNGFKYKSSYLHLRNGFSHDIKKAKASTNAKYKKFAYKRNPSKLCWGTENQKIAVRVGQKVKAGQFIGWAGNTGSGGIGIILDDKGNFKKTTTSFNVHLHFSLYIKDPRPGYSGKWMKIDPYGVYNTAKVSCYDLTSEAPYVRLFAPFYPSFHNVPLKYVNKYWSYYTGMGMGLQTISIDRKNGQLVASGSFQWGLPKAWYARFYMTGATYQKYFNEYNKKGFRPRQMSVTNDSQGQPRFSVIWEKKPAGQKAHAFHNRDGSNFKLLWNTYVNDKKWHLREHITYTVKGKKYHAGIFVHKPNANGFYMYHGMSSTAFNKKFKDLSKKWQLHSMHVNGKTVGGLWRPRKKGYYAYYGLTPSAYQKKFNEMNKKGMKLHKIQAYQGRFAAIWMK